MHLPIYNPSDDVCDMCLTEGDAQKRRESYSHVQLRRRRHTSMCAGEAVRQCPHPAFPRSRCHQRPRGILRVIREDACQGVATCHTTALRDKTTIGYKSFFWEIVVHFLLLIKKIFVSLHRQKEHRGALMLLEMSTEKLRTYPVNLIRIMPA